MPSIATGVALIAASATLWLAQPVFAQTPASITSISSSATPSARPDPLDTKATVPLLRYRSAFQGYRPNVETEIGKWREANDQVGRIGGWRAYAKEAAAPDAPASSAMAEPKR